jgi:hypothetical protein
VYTFVNFFNAHGLSKKVQKEATAIKVGQEAVEAVETNVVAVFHFVASTNL